MYLSIVHMAFVFLLPARSPSGTGIIGRGPMAMADGYGRDLKAADRFTIITDFTKRSLQGNLSRFLKIVVQ